MNPAKPEIVRLTISLDTRTGLLNVEGPTTNRLLAYGMLELAKDQIQKHCEAAENRVEVVSTLPKLTGV